MEGLRLPIEVIPGTNPPQFRWRQVVDSPTGERVVVDHEGTVPVPIERALERLITVARGYAMECASLQGKVNGLEARAANQAALLEKKSEAAQPKRGRG